MAETSSLLRNRTLSGYRGFESLRLRHLAFPRQSLIVLKPAEMRRLFAFRRPYSSLYVPMHPASSVGLSVGLEGASDGKINGDGGQEPD